MTAFGGMTKHEWRMTKSETRLEGGSQLSQRRTFNVRRPTLNGIQVLPITSHQSLNTWVARAAVREGLRTLLVHPKVVPAYGFPSRAFAGAVREGFEPSTKSPLSD
jgi:hypothetical protein